MLEKMIMATVQTGSKGLKGGIDKRIAIVIILMVITLINAFYLFSVPTWLAIHEEQLNSRRALIATDVEKKGNDKKPFRILHVVTSLAEFNNGSR